MKLKWCRAITVTLLIIYFNSVLTNIVSLRQRWFVETINNGTAMTPLYDSLFADWLHGYDIPLQDKITLRDMIDVFTYLWVLSTILIWFVFSRNPVLIAKAISAQMLLVPTFSISQLFTIVPDATPNCLQVYNIPHHTDYWWPFYNYPIRGCGNMLWSSDVTQLVIFTTLASQMVSDRKKVLKCLIWFIGEIWTVATIALILTARYQYSVDVLSTVVVVKLAMTHPWIDHFAKRCFIKKPGYYARSPMQELPDSDIHSRMA